MVLGGRSLLQEKFTPFIENEHGEGTMQTAFPMCFQLFHLTDLAVLWIDQHHKFRPTFLSYFAHHTRSSLCCTMAPTSKRNLLLFRTWILRVNSSLTGVDRMFLNNRR